MIFHISGSFSTLDIPISEANLELWVQHEGCLLSRCFRPVPMISCCYRDRASLGLQGQAPLCCSDLWDPQGLLSLT